MSKYFVFLGGTCGNNNWRESFTASLVAGGVPAERVFNPVMTVPTTSASWMSEEDAKANSQYLMFFIADPKQEGVTISAYSMVEATMGLYDKPEQTVVVFDLTGIENERVVKATNRTQKLMKQRFPNANIFGTVEEAVAFLSKK